MKNSIGFVLILICFSIGMQAQKTQTIRGTIVDKESSFPLIGVNIALQLESGSNVGSTTDLDGNFRMMDIPLGRHLISLSYIGYEDVILNDIIVNVGKETILQIEMEESIIEIEEVTIVARRNGEVSNEMATVSAREFSVAETNRYAGSRGEPARMASNFAGVQGANDSRNDVVIRGNTPTGVLWRLDGVNIPNPNHFSIPGTGGGSVTILNNKFLKNSDFYTGAFPAEYGNGIAGVFDLKMRNGNNEKHEFSGQLGFLGTEIMAEGPISKEKRSSYLATYRYSTLQLFQFLGIDVGTNALPKYQDASFRVNYPRKNGGNIAVFGIGGLSDIDILISNETKPSNETLIYGSNDRDQYFGSQMGILGATYSQPVNESTFYRITLAASTSKVNAYHEYIDREVVNGEFEYQANVPILDYEFNENKYSAYGNFVKKLNRKTSVKAGLNIDVYQLSYIDSVRAVNPIINEGDSVSFDPWKVRWNAQDIVPLVQPFVQLKHRFNKKLSGVAGLSALYFGINNKSLSPIEPRLGLSYKIDEKQKLGLGLGLHSQIQSTYLYYYGKSTIGSTPILHNKDEIGLIKSFHIVGSYDRMIGAVGRVKIETYYQYLYDLPVGADGSSFSLINAGSGFSRFFPDDLTIGGNGRNIGLELSLERFFSQGFYYLITTSLFDSKYRSLENVWRNTSFNGKFAANALFAKEWKLNSSSTLNLGSKLTYAGGGWYGEVDLENSLIQQDVIYQDASVNTLKFNPYFRNDIRLAYTLNTEKITHEIAVDLVNVFNTKNVLKKTYAPDHPDGPIVDEYQLGRLPLFYYRIDF